MARPYSARHKSNEPEGDITMTESSNNPRIAQLNDALRNNLVGVQVVVTPGIMALPELDQRAVLEAVRIFNMFTKDNDPYGEHDFGSFTYQGMLINWKIDYYDLNLAYHSEDPADPKKTKRVLTVMLAEEY
jgi:hypothetical protein